MNIIQVVKNIRLYFFTGLLLAGNQQVLAQSKEQTLHELNSLLVNVVMDDLYTPPVAARIYTYPNIAFYECIRFENNDLPALSGKLNGLPTITKSKNDKQVNYFISAVVAYTQVAKNLVGSEYKIEDWKITFLDSVRLSNDTSGLFVSIQYGNLVGDAIIQWLKKDHYNESRGLMRHVTNTGVGNWQPTPIDFAQGLEPHWGTLRPMTMKTPAQFSPKEKLVYNMSKKSVFYKNVIEIYNIVKNLDSTRTAVAWYWDDNPNISIDDGHFNHFVHKISPGGHWIMITRQACIEKNIPVAKASQAYTLASIALFDGFISCWYEKYKTDLIRPVTIIHREVDEKWEPLIQTPPFPEFTSGHAVISNAAAAVLTGLFGDNYAFTDNTEIPFGIKPRRFKSFLKASEETTWSRVYGGIHYPETARISIKQGIAIGQHVLKTFGATAIAKK
ncbi:MAG: vanadium-dependent haloperoxidase [Chitinophagaceae bacterium]|nr:vanadium-dependent haloperoxidase [Chitinophagaceae bacterium]